MDIDETASEVNGEAGESADETEGEDADEVAEEGRSDGEAKQRSMSCHSPLKRMLPRGGAERLTEARPAKEREAAEAGPEWPAEAGENRAERPAEAEVGEGP